MIARVTQSKLDCDSFDLGRRNICHETAETPRTTKFWREEAIEENCTIQHNEANKDQRS